MRMQLTTIMTMESTMPTMPQMRPALPWPSVPPALKYFPASTMATMPSAMPTMGMKQKTMAKMPQTNALVGLG